jgi:hypothetical protein
MCMTGGCGGKKNKPQTGQKPSTPHKAQSGQVRKTNWRVGTGSPKVKFNFRGRG